MALNNGNESEEGLAVAAASPVHSGMLACSLRFPALAVRQAQEELPQRVTAGPWALLTIY